MARGLARAGFYISLGLYVYGTLFPFDWILSHDQLSTAWSQVHFYPFWDPERGRIHSLPDIVSNVLLAAPIGFFGFILRGRNGVGIVKWGLACFALGLTAEVLQLGIPERHSLLTDALSGGVGGVVGATAARAWGRGILGFLAGGWGGPARTWLIIVLFVIAAVKLGPLDLTLDVSSIRGDVRHILDDPWNRSKAPQEEWNTMAAFVLLGALLGSLLRARDWPYGLPPGFAVIALLLLPWAFEFGQIFLESHSPSLLSGAMDTAGAVAGLAMSIFSPQWLRPRVGLGIVGAGLAAAGLSPYRFVPWQSRTPFQWVPLVEYYQHTNAAALYDAGAGVLTFGLFGALLEQSSECRPWLAAVGTAAFALLIEFAQQFVAGRYPGVTDVLLAALGGWIGSKASANFRD